jgi:hypothetical protein
MGMDLSIYNWDLRRRRSRRFALPTDYNTMRCTYKLESIEQKKCSRVESFPQATQEPRTQIKMMAAAVNTSPDQASNQLPLYERAHLLL